jgi:NTP pyrophosphatase (non-canonical NTP hydrolase)
MIDLKALQKEIFKNKVDKGFNTSDVPKEFAFIHEEVSEAFRAYRKKLPDLGEEIADVTIYLLGLSEMIGIDLEAELLKKIEKNKNREYKEIDGVLTRIKEG